MPRTPRRNRRGGPPRGALPWPLPDRLGLRDRLLAAYSSPSRGYHDLQHLTEVLTRIDELGFADRREVVLAAWYHDAVYDGATDAEERSARLASTELAGADVDAAEVARLVRLTAAHTPTAGDTAGGVLCDADLAILAAPTARYAEYVAGVRLEYAAYSDLDFATGRIAVLQALLAKPTLFNTPHGRTHWEPAARANVTAELEWLLERL